VPQDVSANARVVCTREGPPPGGPWLELADDGIGYLSFYYSDPLARFPIREATRPGDNKSDPNLETGTYGLFSTCEPGMRNRIVADGAASLFFITRHAGKPRAVTGYYDIGWYTHGDRGTDSKDWALAARNLRFVDPIPFPKIARSVPEAGEPSFRTQRRLSDRSVTRLRAIVDRAPDRTAEYLAELSRVERFAASKSGYAYPSWGRVDGFRETDAPTFLSASLGGTANSSKSRQWVCSSCSKIITNNALLRACPVCGGVGTLSPLILEET
jgi:hypothetical protein